MNSLLLLYKNWFVILDTDDVVLAAGPKVHDDVDVGKGSRRRRGWGQHNFNLNNKIKFSRL